MPIWRRINNENFILKHIEINKNNWKVQPKLHYGKGFQDNLILVFGKAQILQYSLI